MLYFFALARVLRLRVAFAGTSLFGKPLPRAFAGALDLRWASAPPFCHNFHEAVRFVIRYSGILWANRKKSAKFQSVDGELRHMAASTGNLGSRQSWSAFG